MINPHGVWATFRYEWKRSLNISRIGWWLAIALFPVLIVGWIGGNNLNNTAEAASLLFYLIVQVMCMVGLLLHASPAVQAEQEAKTWGYIAVRPDGKATMLIGKYLKAVTWTALAATIGITGSLFLIAPDNMGKLWMSLVAVAWMGCIGYGALFIFLGVLFLKRSFVAAIVYAVIFEFIITLVPAVIHELTLAFHLRSILYRVLDIQSVDVSLLFSSASMIRMVLSVFIYTFVFLTFAAYILNRRELITVEEIQ